MQWVRSSPYLQPVHNRQLVDKTLAQTGNFQNLTVVGHNYKSGRAT